MPRDFRDHRHLETAVPQFLDKGFGMRSPQHPPRRIYAASPDSFDCEQRPLNVDKNDPRDFLQHPGLRLPTAQSTK